MRPYYLARRGREEGPFVRVGSTNRQASPEMLAELERTARNVAFDELPMPRLRPEDLDLELARVRFAGRRDLTPRDLKRLHLVVEEGRRRVPTHGGVLLFGRERLRRFPDARLRLARFSGTTRSNMADRLEVENPGLLPFGLTLDKARLGSPSSAIASSVVSFTISA